MAEESKLILDPSGQPANDELKATESAHNTLLTEHRELLVEHQDLMKEIVVVKGDRDAWRRKYDALAASNKEMDDAHKALVADHKELLAALPPSMKPKPEYVYGKDECQPVTSNGICQRCGWSSDPLNPKHQDPHPVVGVIAKPPSTKEKKPADYVYAEDECRPVSAHGKCDKCGWTHGSPEPHATI